MLYKSSQKKLFVYMLFFGQALPTIQMANKNGKKAAHW